MSSTSSSDRDVPGYSNTNTLPYSSMSLNEARAQFAVPSEIEVEFHKFDHVDVDQSRDGFLVIPLDSLRLGLRFPLCLNLLRLFDSP